jgi:hypothetical protein
MSQTFILEFDCSVCKKLYGKAKQRHGLKKSQELTVNEWFATCFGCGVFGIKIVDDLKIDVISL